jgi:NADPH-dependent ferric siderophore reductase
LNKSGKREILIEFVVHKNVVKATAIDAETGVEASIVGPVHAAREALAQGAVRKLKYVLGKKR